MSKPIYPQILTNAEARGKVCPIKSSDNGLSYCNGEGCMLWAKHHEYTNPVALPESRGFCGLYNIDLPETKGETS